MTLFGVMLNEDQRAAILWGIDSLNISYEGALKRLWDSDEAREQRIIQLEAQVALLREHVRRAEHTTGCRLAARDGPETDTHCTCGLTAALATTDADAVMQEQP